MKKIILVIVILLIACGVMLFMNLDSAAKAIIEAAGSKAVGTQVRVGSFDVSFASRAANMSSLSVANPKGFSSDYLLKTQKISVTLGDVSTKLVIIKEVVVDGMSVNYELGQQGTNLDALQSNIRSGGGKEAPAQAGATSNSPEVVIETLRITNAKVTPSVGAIQKQISLPDIVLTNIGSKSNPATPVQVASQVIAKVLTVSTTAVMQSGFGAPVDTIQKGIKSLLPR